MNLWYLGFKVIKFISIQSDSRQMDIHYRQLNVVCSTSVHWFCVCGGAHMSCHVQPQAPAPKAQRCWTTLSGSLPPFLQLSHFSLHLIPLPPGTSWDCSRTGGAPAVLTQSLLMLSRLPGVTKTVNILDSVEQKAEWLQLDFSKGQCIFQSSPLWPTLQTTYNHT